MIMVFLAHVKITNHFLPSPVPSWFSLIVNQIIHGSGFIGVSLFFILSGFLMCYLYPNPTSKIQFIQKRYKRIFPLFFTVSIASLLIMEISNLAWYLNIGILLSFAVLANFMWVKVIRKVKWNGLSKTLFWTFSLLQIVIGTFIFVFSNIYSITAFFHLPHIFQFLMKTFAYSTLTFPLGGSIPRIQLPYSTLSMEILFYIIYPILFVPVFNARLLRNNTRKFLFVIALIPFSCLLYLLVSPIQRLYDMQPHLIFHFIVGITLGYLYRNNSNLFKNLNRYFNNKLYYLPVLLLIGVMFLFHYLIYQFNNYSIWIAIIISIPLALIMGVMLNSETSLAKIFSSKLLIFLGTISYSMYLSHIVIISLVNSILIPDKTNKYIGSAEEILFACIAFLITIIISFILYQLLEKPYFVRNVNSVTPKTKLVLSQVRRLDKQASAL